MFHVFLSNNAQKGRDRCDEKLKIRLKGLFDLLKQNPVPTDQFDVTKISGSYSNYRIRIGSIRVIYTVYWRESEIRVHDIDRKKDRTYT